MSGAPTLITAPLFVLLVMFLALVIGCRVLRRTGLDTSGTTVDRFVVAVALGIGIIQYLPFALGVVGLLSPWGIRITLTLCLLVALRDVPELRASCRGAWARRPRLERWQWVWAVLLTAPLVHVLFQSLEPSIDPDGVGYHLAAPKRWLQLGWLSFLPTQTYTNGPMGTEMLYATALGVVGDAGAKLTHATAALIAAVGVFLVGQRVAHRVGAPLVGYLAVVLYLYSPAGIVSVMGASYAEGTSSLAIVASALGWVLWFESGDRRWLWVAALLAGMAITFKLTAVVFPISLIVLTVLVVRHRGRDACGLTGLSGRGIAALLATVALPMIPWMIRSTIVVHNPIFPVLARWIPSRGFPPEASRAFEEYNRYMIWGNGARLYDLSLENRKLVVMACAIVTVIVGGLIVWRLRDQMARWVTIVVVGTIVVQLYAAGLYMRYWTPLFAVIQVPILAYVLRPARPGLVKALVMTAAVLVAGREFRSFAQNDPGQLVLASIGNAARQDRLEERSLATLYQVANGLADDDQSLLMGYGCATFYFDGRALCIETLETTLRPDDWDAFNAALRRYNVQFVIAPTVLGSGERPPTYRSARAVGDLVREDEFDVLSRLLVERGDVLQTVRDQSLFRLAPP